MRQASPFTIPAGTGSVNGSDSTATDSMTPTKSHWFRWDSVIRGPEDLVIYHPARNALKLGARRSLPNYVR